jgi:5-dehydro-2-deoxygluconokinase
MNEGRRKVVVMCDLIADLSLRIDTFPVRAQDLQQMSYPEIGPGGATNVAITASRFGLPVSCLGEVGDDRFGTVVLEGLKREGVDVTGVAVTSGAQTPVAGVLVDERGEPAYLGYPGTLTLDKLPHTWEAAIEFATAVFADGWVEHEGIAAVILKAFRHARAVKVPVFFDPGPGNPRLPKGNAWHLDAAALATVVLLNEQEAARLTALADPLAAARMLLANGAELVVLKRGVAGCLLVVQHSLQVAAGFPVEARDATGAGDSLAGAVIYGYLNGLSLPALGTLANATGAAKVRKLGTGHNMPTLTEVREVLEKFGQDPQVLISG